MSATSLERKRRTYLRNQISTKDIDAREREIVKSLDLGVFCRAAEARILRALRFSRPPRCKKIAIGEIRVTFAELQLRYLLRGRIRVCTFRCVRYFLHKSQIVDKDTKNITAKINIRHTCPQ